MVSKLDNGVARPLLGEILYIGYYSNNFKQDQCTTLFIISTSFYYIVSEITLQLCRLPIYQFEIASGWLYTV